MITNGYADTEEQKKNFREKPEEYLQYRKRVEEEINMNWGAVMIHLLRLFSSDSDCRLVDDQRDSGSGTSLGVFPGGNVTQT